MVGGKYNSETDCPDCHGWGFVKFDDPNKGCYVDRKCISCSGTGSIKGYKSKILSDKLEQEKKDEVILQRLNNCKNKAMELVASFEIKAIDKTTVIGYDARELIELTIALFNAGYVGDLKCS